MVFILENIFELLTSLPRWSTTGNETKPNNPAEDILKSPNCTINNNNNNNGSPSKTDDFVASVLGVPQIILPKPDSPPNGNQAYQENPTSTFASPNSDIVTSSPNANPEQFQMLTTSERDLVVMVSINMFIIVSTIF